MPALRCADCGGDHATGLCSTMMSPLAPPVPEGHLPLPRKGLAVNNAIGTWRLKKLLGRGSSADVFLAENEVTQAVAAVKVLRADLHEDPEIVRRFEVEARTTNLVRHDHIVEIYDIGTWANWQHYILLEHLEGVTMAKMLERPVEPAIASRLVLQLCAGLGAAHQKGVVHRDLKPANIFVVQRGGQPHAKLVDFGMARREQLGAGEVRTRVGSILGTALYMSPEQTLGGDIDGRADIYSLGVVMFELATNKLPFEGAGPIEVMRMHLKDPPRRPTTLNPNISLAYEEVILRCLAKEAAQRWDTMADLGRAIVMALDGKTPPARAAATQPAGPSITPVFGGAKTPARAYGVPTQPAGVTTRDALAGVRRQARIPTSFGIQLFDEHGTLLGDALVTDVSLGGAFVRSTLVLPLFSRVRFKGSSSAGPLDILAEVVRFETDEGQQRGFGVRFLSVGPEQQRVLDALHQKTPGAGSPEVGDRQGEAVLQQFEPRVAQGHYALLGVPKDSTTRRIRDVCERLAEEMSPKRFEQLSAAQAKRFDVLRVKVTEAEEELIDPERRALYDALNGNLLGVLRCITEGLDLERLNALREKFLQSKPAAVAKARGPMNASTRAEQQGDLKGALQALIDALSADPLNAALHQHAGELRQRAKAR